MPKAKGFFAYTICINHICHCISGAYWKVVCTEVSVFLFCTYMLFWRQFVKKHLQYQVNQTAQSLEHTTSGWQDLITHFFSALTIDSIVDLDHIPRCPSKCSPSCYVGLRCVQLSLFWHSLCTVLFLFQFSRRCSYTPNVHLSWYFVVSFYVTGSVDPGKWIHGSPDSYSPRSIQDPSQNRFLHRRKQIPLLCNRSRGSYMDPAFLGF